MTNCKGIRVQWLKIKKTTNVRPKPTKSGHVEKQLNIIFVGCNWMYIECCQTREMKIYNFLVTYNHNKNQQQNETERSNKVLKPLVLHKLSRSQVFNLPTTIPPCQPPPKNTIDQNRFKNTHTHTQPGPHWPQTKQIKTVQHPIKGWLETKHTTTARAHAQRFHYLDDSN